ncbi:hypothetical protein DFH08DRAFT_813952 [Mycena albidolilacea]|uniref:Uncharacterized protein n=1 Tax=Mycena albidolilacea TaxID=1033008 RepID=A0AAD6ZRU5_9AGAR|nr:hypothetical protein DFH08DRAFT_813952 [Mycena albidolilacea]
MSRKVETRAAMPIAASLQCSGSDMLFHYIQISVFLLSLVTANKVSMWNFTSEVLGLGLHLQKLASNMPYKPDLLQPQHNIQDLNLYDHLARVFCICIVHNFQNIKKCAVSEEVRWLMCGLVCLEHDEWEGTLATIQEKGSKAGNDWVNGKESSQFFFPGICWECSFIPLDIWNAGDSNSNLIESVHFDVNREGVHCTLLGGLQRAQLFDALKMKTLIVSQVLASNIDSDWNRHTKTMVLRRRTRPDTSENMYNNLKHKANSQHCVLSVKDEKIDCYNKKLLKSLNTLAKAEKAVVAKEKQLSEEQ